jgi:hypothetical protein
MIEMPPAAVNAWAFFSALKPEQRVFLKTISYDDDCNITLRFANGESRLSVGFENGYRGYGYTLKNASQEQFVAGLNDMSDSDPSIIAEDITRFFEETL